jgi:glycerol kinase
MWSEAARYEPAMPGAERDRLLGRWAEAVSRSRGWAEKDSGDPPE